MDRPEPLLLGVDTGGTYTDAVLYREGDGIVAKAKALTTRHDLAVGIGEAAASVITSADIEPSAIGLVSMSTTLATNALVEGHGGRVALVMIGFDERDLARDGLPVALGGDPVIFCPGGHDVHGNEADLDLGPLRDALPDLSENVTGVAIAAYFAIRNPAHELAARDLVRSMSDLPVTCSHELSSRLGGPRRALTTLLNARLVSLIARLIESTGRFMTAKGIRAPLMMVRGDGALISSEEAGRRPIETILSGPAASIVGARQLTGFANAIVSDIGGTTTDIAVLEGGQPRLDPDGATIGGYRTMVEAVAMRTYGLGGDSEVRLEEDALDPQIILGPRRSVPISLAGHLFPDRIHVDLDRQLRAGAPGRLDGRFAVRTGVPDRLAAGLAPGEAKLYAAVDIAPLAVDQLIGSTLQLSTLDRLVSRGLVQIIAFTPSDAAHVLGLQDNWNRKAAELGARLFARRRTGRGHAIAASACEIAERVLETVTRRSAEVIFETAFVEDGLDGRAVMASPVVRRALSGRSGIVRTTMVFDRPVVGLGASAPVHYAALSDRTGSECVVPPDTDVANALGAVAGQVRSRVEAVVTRPSDDTFRVSVGEIVRDLPLEADALVFAEAHACELAEAKARDSGAGSVAVSVRRQINAVPIEGRRMFIEARIIATATGRPGIAHNRSDNAPKK